MGTYSKAPQAAKKRAIDAKVEGQIDIDDGAYLKYLIVEASKGSVTVGDKTNGLQFFFIKGGGEGFLDASYAGKDASRMIQLADTTSASGIEMIFEDNDLLVVFDSKGKLVSSALLGVPIFVAPSSPTAHDGLREITAKSTHDAWDGRPVSLYRNENYQVKYYGLLIDDSLGRYRSGAVRIDLHKEEDTNGCIFIKDKDTPSLSHVAVLNAFEPKLIKDIQHSIGKTAKANIGIMHMIKIE
jgi:hypothetical protein